MRLKRRRLLLLLLSKVGSHPREEEVAEVEENSEEEAEASSEETEVAESREVETRMMTSKRSPKMEREMITSEVEVAVEEANSEEEASEVIEETEVTEVEISRLRRVNLFQVLRTLSSPKRKLKKLKNECDELININTNVSMKMQFLGASLTLRRIANLERLG